MPQDIAAAYLRAMVAEVIGAHFYRHSWVVYQHPARAAAYGATRWSGVRLRDRLHRETVVVRPLRCLGGTTMDLWSMAWDDLAKIEDRDDLTVDQQLKIAEIKALLSISQDLSRIRHSGINPEFKATA